jgi:hypothetical protein
MKAENINVNIKFTGPSILSKNIDKNKIILILNWGMFGIGTTIITKTKQGYTYEDVGVFKRNFKEIEHMVWEYELPKELIKDIQSLEINKKNT